MRCVAELTFAGKPARPLGMTGGGLNFHIVRQYFDFC
jgi:hypothetical protein